MQKLEGLGSYLSKLMTGEGTEPIIGALWLKSNYRKHWRVIQHYDIVDFNSEFKEQVMKL